MDELARESGVARDEIQHFIEVGVIGSTPEVHVG